MKFWALLSVIVILGGSYAADSDSDSDSNSDDSASDITLMVQLFRTIGSNTTVQQFTITLSDFSTILRKLSKILKDEPSNDLTDKLSSLTSTLQKLITRIVNDPSDQDAVSKLSNNLLLLLNTLSASNDPDLKAILQEIETSFETDQDSDDSDSDSSSSSRRTSSSSKRTKTSQSSKSSQGSRSSQSSRSSQGSRTSKGSKSSKGSGRQVNQDTDPSVVVVNINMTTNSQVNNLISTLTTLADAASDPGVVDLLNQLIDLLRRFSKDNDFSTLIEILRTALPLFNQDESDINLPGTANNVVSTLLGSLDPSDGRSQLITFLLGLIEVGSLTTGEGDEALGLLGSNGQGNIIKALTTILQTLTPRVPSALSSPFKALQQQLAALSRNQDSSTVTSTLSALRNLVGALAKYNGADRGSIVSIVRLIINTLRFALRNNSSAISTLRSLSSKLDSLPAAPAPSQPSARTSQSSNTQQQQQQQQQQQRRGRRCGGILSHFVCFVSDFFVGPKGDSGLLGGMNGLFGGSLAGNPGGWSWANAAIPQVLPSVGTRSRSNDGRSGQQWGIPGMYRRFVNAIF